MTIKLPGETAIRTVNAAIQELEYCLKAGSHEEIEDHIREAINRIKEGDGNIAAYQKEIEIRNKQADDIEWLTIQMERAISQIIPELKEDHQGNIWEGKINNNTCPKCGGPVTGESVEFISRDALTQDVTCDKCGYIFRHYYKLTTVEEL